MTVEKNKATARREVEEFEGKGNTSVVAELFGPGYALHFPGSPALGRAGHEQVIRGFRAAFPDLRISVREQVASGDRVANRWVAHATHRGAFQGVPATGKEVTITGSNVMLVAGGTVRELWGQLDAIGLLGQLGVFPAPPAEIAPDAQSPVTDDAGASAVVRRFIDRFNEGQLGAIADDFGDDYVLDFPGGPSGRGRDGLRRATSEFRSAFPDMHFATKDLFEERGRVAWRWTMTGTHRGDLGPFRASQRPVALNGISVLYVRGGKIVRDCVRADMAGMLAQIGAIPGPH